MTWGFKRRARIANIVGDVGKIVLGTVGLAPFAGPGTVNWWMAGTASAAALVCFACAAWVEKEDADEHG